MMFHGTGEKMVSCIVENDQGISGLTGIAVPCHYEFHAGR
jgi:hypothetical protein